MEIKNGRLAVYDVSDDYRNDIRRYDKKVSMKEGRRYYGILVTRNGKDYCIPFTSQIKKRNSKLTINIRHVEKVIAQLLLNNMIPVYDCVVSLVDVDSDIDKEYLSDEIVSSKKYVVIFDC